MNRLNLVVLIVGVAVLSFLAGSRLQQKSSAEGASPGGRRILYYVDPMHPAYRSDKPGVAPDCGMELEPVYAAAEAGQASSMPGTVDVSPENQRRMGIRVEEVRTAAAKHSVRLLGRVAADERRLYFLNAATDGWIQNTFSNSTGSFVKKDEVLATCYAPEFLAAEQAYFYALNALDRFKASGRETPDQIATIQVSIKQAADGLRNMGMGDVQIQALARTRRATDNIEIRSPASGFILERNVSQGLRFERGKQLYRIADLSRIWILADVFENQTQYFRPGARARAVLPTRQDSFPVVMSEVPPIFDPAARTLKLRFEADNPRLALRPDMFVDVELPVNSPAAPTIPADAVLDSGLRKIVYVERSPGAFEPRTVDVLWRHGDRVGLAKGLEPGERVVVSGTFLLDSESRMKSAAPLVRPTDPVCGMPVDPVKALKAEHTGATYYFCSPDCRRNFQRDPRQYLSSGARSNTAVPSPDTVSP